MNNNEADDEIKIFGACYGLNDVTEKVREEISKNGKLFATNALFGDSFFGAVKTLVVVYGRSLSNPVVAIVQEDGQFFPSVPKNLNNNNDNQLTPLSGILGAAYGKADVTHHLRQLVSSNSSTDTVLVNATNQVFGENWWGHPKSLVVVGFSQSNRNEKPECYVLYVPEHSQLSLPTRIDVAPRNNFSDITIFGACYGLADVTEKVRLEISKKGQVYATNFVFGDSWFGIVKTLVVVYGKSITSASVAIVEENGIFIPIISNNTKDSNFPIGGILGAAYGKADVTKKLRDMMISNPNKEILQFVVNNDVFGHYWYGRKSFVVVGFTYPNPTENVHFYVYVVDESSQITIPIPFHVISLETNFGKKIIRLPFGASTDLLLKTGNDAFQNPSHHRSFHSTSLISETSDNNNSFQNYNVFANLKISFLGVNPQQAIPMPQEKMHKINHVVVLMLENRSFDSMLSNLYDNKEKIPNEKNLPFLETTPITHLLAEKYAICDEWFSSVETESWPNRLLFHYGTNFDISENNSETKEHKWKLYLNWINLFYARKQTFFEKTAIQNPLFTHKIYQHSNSLSMSSMFGLLNSTKTANFEELALDASEKDRNLPSFSFVEPRYDSLNPLEDEKTILDTYEALFGLNAKDPESTLLIITYSNSGGHFDHISTPNIGTRVPAIFISPWISEKTILRRQNQVDQPFDHCSVSRSIRMRWSNPQPISAREEQASSFWPVLNGQSARSRSEAVSLISDLKTKLKFSQEKQQQLLNNNELSLPPLAEGLATIQILNELCVSIAAARVINEDPNSNNIPSNFPRIEVITSTKTTFERLRLENRLTFRNKQEFNNIDFSEIKGKSFREQVELKISKAKSLHSQFLSEPTIEIAKKLIDTRVPSDLILKDIRKACKAQPRTLGFELLTKLDSFEKQMFEKGKEFQEEFLPPNVFTLDVDEAEYVEPKRKKQKGKKGGSRRK